MPAQPQSAGSRLRSLHLAWVLLAIACFVYLLEVWPSASPDALPAVADTASRPAIDRGAGAMELRALREAPLEARARGAQASEQALVPGASAPASVRVVVQDVIGRRVGEAEIVLARDGAVAVDDLRKVEGHSNSSGVAVIGVFEESKFVGARKGPARSALTHIATSAHGGTPPEVVLVVVEDDVMIEGRVIDEKDIGVADAAVDVWQSRVVAVGARATRNNDVPDRRSARTNEQGQFRLSVSRERRPYVVRATAGDRASRVKSLPLDGVGSTEWVVLELPGRAVLEGVVLDWRGTPAPDCAVIVEKGDGVESDNQHTRTDAAGRFSARFFAGGECWVIPTGNATVAGGAAVQANLAEDKVTHVSLSTREPALLEGVATGITAGKHAVVRAVPTAESGWHMREVAVTSSDGRFQITGLVRGWEYELFLFVNEDQRGSTRGVAGVTRDLQLDASKRPLDASPKPRERR